MVELFHALRQVDHPPQKRSAGLYHTTCVLELTDQGEYSLFVHTFFVSHFRISSCSLLSLLSGNRTTIICVSSSMPRKTRHDVGPSVLWGGHWYPQLHAQRQRLLQRLLALPRTRTACYQEVIQVVNGIHACLPQYPLQAIRNCGIYFGG